MKSSGIYTNALIAFNQGAGNSQAIGVLAFSGQQITISRLSAYVIQAGSTGNFQLAVLQPTSQTSALVIAVTSMVTSLTAGRIILSLTASITLSGNIDYYLVAYNQINEFIQNRYGLRRKML